MEFAPIFVSDSEKMKIWCSTEQLFFVLEKRRRPSNPSEDIEVRPPESSFSDIAKSDELPIRTSPSDAGTLVKWTFSILASKSTFLDVPKKDTKFK